MIIPNHVLLQLYKKYKSNFPDGNTQPQEEFNQAFQTIDDQLNGYFDWGSLVSEENLNIELNSLLEQSLQINRETKSLQFDELNAKFSINNFAQQFKQVTQLKIASLKNEQGIQEKFLKSFLVKDIKPSKIDMQRHILQTNMTGHIGVVDETAETMGLYLANAKQQYEKERGLVPHHPYPVAMMVNCNSNPKDDALWASVVITIDPQNNQASYETTSEHTLTSNQKQSLTVHIDNALKFKRTSLVTGLAIESYPDITITLRKQKEDAGYTGYQVLHQLYNNNQLSHLIRERDNALAFKKIAPELAEQAVFDKQIQAIKIESQIFNLFKSKPHPQHPVVSDVIKDVKITDNKITFPRVKPDTPLAAEDYQIFILLLIEKFDSSGLDKNLTELEVNCFGLAAIQGLAQLRSQASNLPFEKLTLELPQVMEVSDKAGFKFNLKLALMSLSESNLAKMQLSDKGSIFNEEDIAELTDFIEKNNIAIDLTLPGKFATSTYQRRADIATSQSILNRNAYNFLNENNFDPTPIARPVRTRPLVSSKNLSIDIELQQEVQVEVAVEGSVEKSAQVDDVDQESELYTLESYKRALKDGSFSFQSKSYLIPVYDDIWINWLGYYDTDEAEEGLQISKPALEELMRYADKFQYGIGFLKKGDEYHNLPAGFTVKKKDGESYLDFDPKLKLISEKNLLAVQTRDAKPDAVLSAVQIQKWIDANPDHPFRAVWDEQLRAPTYDKQTLCALQSALPKIAQMSVDQVEELFKLCINEGKIEVEKLNFLVNDAAKAKQLFSLGDVPENEGVKRHMRRLFGPQYPAAVVFISSSLAGKSDRILLTGILSTKDISIVENIKSKIDSINMNELLQLYLQSGSKGLDNLSILLTNAGDELAIYQEVINSISINEGSYQQIITDEFHDSLKIFSSLPDNERQLFSKLFEQHAKHNSNVDFAELMNSFVKFRHELKTLAQPGYEFKLPDECALTDVKSMPLALARIVALVRHVKQENRQEQLLESHKLDLSSTGMIQAVSRSFNAGKQWNFVTHEMQLNQSHEHDKDKTHLEAYKSDLVRKRRNFFTDSGQGLSEEFFRYVAFQSKKGSLSFEFYKHADAKIKNSSWSDQNKRLFYNLIAASSTAESNIKFSKNSKEAVADFNALFEKIDNPPNPGGLGFVMGKDAMREQVLGNLNVLDSVPTLPVLSRLVTLISNSLSSALNVIANARALGEANNSLNTMAHKGKYGDSVYKGMSCYQNSDYGNGKLFFEHMATIEAIYEQSHMDNGHDPHTHIMGESLLRLISTFHLKADSANPNNDKLRPVFATLEELGNENLGNRIELLSILNRLDPERYLTLPPLSHTHLSALMKAVRNPKYDTTLDAIKDFEVNNHKLSEYFDPRFLQNYGKRQVPEDVKLKIEGAFDEAARPVVEDILLNFTDKNDANEYGSVVDKIISICSGLTKIEQNLFISKLNQAKGLYSNPTPLSDENNTFNQILSSLEDQGSPDELLNFIASDQALFQKLAKDGNQNKFYVGDPVYNQGLAKKAVLFSRDIYSAIRQNKELVLSKLEITPRLHELLLRTPVEQLEKESSVSNIDTKKSQIYLTKSQALLDTFKEDSASKKIDLAALNIGLTDFKERSNFSNKGILNALQETIEELQKPLGISETDLLEIAINPSAQELFSYFGNTMSVVKKADFEKKHGKFIEGQIAKHPNLLNNKATIGLLLDSSNLNLLKKTMQGDSLAALKSTDLLTDETTFNAFLTALEQDVNTLNGLKESADHVHKEVEKYQKSLKQYSNVVLALVDKMGGIVSESPSAYGQFLELFDKFVEHYEPEQGEMMLALHNFVDQLAPLFAMIEDKNVVLSLCMQFNGDEELQPEDLQDLITTIKTVDNIEYQKLLINVAVNLLNNKKGYKLNDDSGNDFAKICELAKDEETFSTTLKTFYDKPPYPDLEQILQIHHDARQTDDYDQTIQKSAQEFDKKPCHRETDINGFHVDEAVNQLAKFNGYQTTREKLEGFYKKTVDMREKSSDDLLVILRAFRPNSENPSKDMETLVAVSAELFYRSKGKDAYNTDGSFKLGSSMEINTTQYLAILSSLETDGHVTSQIGTGEGKSRIMMISNVCQWALGNTVDFVTSDAQLATRDYVEYQAYFNMVGAKTSMIFANSNTSAYQIGGINFSDPSNLSLFRNKAKSLGNEEQVLDRDENKRALMLDEADKTYFDVADTRFNFSREGDDSIQNMSWMYPILMEYFEQESISADKSISSTGKLSPIILFYTNVDASRESFLAFAGSHCSRQDFIRLKSLSEQQIEQWLVSSVTASQLQFKKDFVISPDQLISTPTGPRISSEAQLLFANRIAKGSKFSFGVHQCLHARLNRLRQQPEKIDNDELRQELTLCEQGFYIADEKQIVYSSTSKNLIDNYKKGTLKAVTGTAGSLIERTESRKLYEDMLFIDVPRAKGMSRDDKGIEFCKDENSQVKTLINNIREAQKKNQPILIIAENDEESGKWFKLLRKHFPQDVQLIHSQLSSKEEQEKIKEAGLPRRITVSTDMIGRGTDIELRNRILSDGSEVSAKENGLNVMVTYLPRVRDLEQIIGRSGRFGSKGETSLILDEPRLLKKLGMKKLPQDYVRDSSAFIKREQAKMDRKSQADRLLKNHVGDFRMALNIRFFNDLLPLVPHASKKELITYSTVFFEKSDKAWNQVWPPIQQQLQKLNITEAELTEVECLLNQYGEATQKEWTSMVSKVRDLNIVCFDKETKAHDILKADVPSIILNDEVKHLFTAIKFSKQEVPHDSNRYKKTFAGVLGSIGVGIGVALIATGILAPLGVGLIATIVIAAVAGAAIGASAGLASGAVADAIVKPEPTEVLTFDPDDLPKKDPKQEVVPTEENPPSRNGSYVRMTNEIRSLSEDEEAEFLDEDGLDKGSNSTQRIAPKEDKTQPFQDDETSDTLRNKL